MTFFKLLAVLISMQLLHIPNATAEPLLGLTPRDIQRLGQDYLGKRVAVSTYLNNVYACRAPSLQGQACAEMGDRAPWFYNAVLTSKVNRDDYGILIKKYVIMYGKIELMDLDVRGKVHNVPQILVERIVPSN